MDTRTFWFRLFLLFVGFLLIIALIVAVMAGGWNGATELFAGMLAIILPTIAFAYWQDVKYENYARYHREGH